MASQGKRPENQNMLDPFMVGIVIFLVIMLAVIFWNRFHTAIATAYSWLRLGEFSVFWGIGEIIPSIPNPFHDWFTFFKDSDRSLIQWEHMMSSSLLANIFTLVFVILPAAWFVAKCSMRTNPYNHKHFGKAKDYTLHSFTDLMGEHYPHLKLFRKLNLTKRPINSGHYRMADTEKQFAIHHGLLDRVGKSNAEFKVNRERATEVFKQQLGRMWLCHDNSAPWTGFARLSRWEYAVVAALVPRIAATDEAMSDVDYKAALKTTDDLIAGYWTSAAETFEDAKNEIQLDLDDAKEAIRKYGRHPKVTRLLRQHAYVATVIYAMLTEARKLGVLASCDLRWLRVVDRRLWLLVNNVGRIVAFPEVGGIYAHFLWEHRQRRAYERPQIESATRGLVEAIDNYQFTEEEVAEVAQRLDAVPAAPVIDVAAVEKQRRTLFLAVMAVGVGGQQELLDVAVVSESGDTVYAERCKPVCDLDEDTKRSLGLDADDIAELAKKPVAAKLKEKVLEICNGHRVVVYSESSLSVISGIDRSAGEIVACAPVLGEGAPGTVYDAATTLQLGVPVPSKRSAADEAQACRKIWVELQKRVMKAQRAGSGGQ